MKRIPMDTISISEIERNLHKLDDFNIVEVVDKKRHQIKVYYLDKKYHDVVEALLNENRKRNTKKLKALEELGSYALGGLNIEEIKSSSYNDKKFVAGKIKALSLDEALKIV